MSTELELKFSMAPAYLAQLISALPQLGLLQHSDNATLLNAYFDTADNWFRRHDMGLRSRLKRGRYEQTIKLSGAQHGAMQMRPEYNVACAGVVPQLVDFPAQIWPQGTDVATLQQQLTELFRTDFSRQSWQLLCSDGSKVELVYDQGQVIANGRSQPIAELELELLSGNARQLFNLARLLCQQLPLHTGWQSKAARGYRLAKQQSIPLPGAAEPALLAQIAALQQAEACYLQNSDHSLQNSEHGAIAAAALQLAAQSLLQISDLLKPVLTLQAQCTAAANLAADLSAGQAIFGSKTYNLLLLSLSEHLYFSA